MPKVVGPVPRTDRDGGADIGRSPAIELDAQPSLQPMFPERRIDRRQNRGRQIMTSEPAIDHRQEGLADGPAAETHQHQRTAVAAGYRKRRRQVIEIQVQDGQRSGRIFTIRSSRPALREAGLLTRDPRAKERKKYGLKRARKAPQYTKR